MLAWALAEHPASPCDSFDHCRRWGLELRAQVQANNTLELWVLTGTRWGEACRKETVRSLMPWVHFGIQLVPEAASILAISCYFHCQILMLFLAVTFSVPSSSSRRRGNSEATGTGREIGDPERVEKLKQQHPCATPLRTFDSKYLDLLFRH